MEEVHTGYDDGGRANQGRKVFLEGILQKSVN